MAWWQGAQNRGHFLVSLRVYFCNTIDFVNIYPKQELKPRVTLDPFPFGCLRELPSCRIWSRGFSERLISGHRVINGSGQRLTDLIIGPKAEKCNSSHNPEIDIDNFTTKLGTRHGMAVIIWIQVYIRLPCLSGLSTIYSSTKRPKMVLEWSMCQVINSSFFSLTLSLSYLDGKHSPSEGNVVHHAANGMPQCSCV